MQALKDGSWRSTDKHRSLPDDGCSHTIHPQDLDMPKPSDAFRFLDNLDLTVTRQGDCCGQLRCGDHRDSRPRGFFTARGNFRSVSEHSRNVSPMQASRSPAQPHLGYRSDPPREAQASCWHAAPSLSDGPDPRLADSR